MFTIQPKKDERRIVTGKKRGSCILKNIRLAQLEYQLFYVSISLRTQKFVLRVLPKHHNEKKQRDDEVERVRKERQMKREFSLTPSPDDRLTGNVKKREYSASLERLKKKDTDRDKETKKSNSSATMIETEFAAVTVSKMELTVLTDEEAFLADSVRSFRCRDHIFYVGLPAGPQKYSKFDSNPEAGGHDDQTPEHRPMEYSDSEVDVEQEFDPSTATYETLTEEQKALLSPSTKKRFEDEWQARLNSTIAYLLCL
ncbi:hypothetical protein KIN20_009037 [Parelaphostrongylus tenuis]|uniref:Uncharacterized protein n=1 Tax=Parelaphostrongylus tenuis TaxID=148309 RepID=A0AAD5M8W0_PARTN|nr:hypothetical protein KIN20_009037 [Parelaphostrongylus tenuis]